MLESRVVSSVVESECSSLVGMVEGREIVGSRVVGLQAVGSGLSEVVMSVVKRLGGDMALPRESPRPPVRGRIVDEGREE